jgi:hypothetical protein
MMSVLIRNEGRIRVRSRGIREKEEIEARINKEMPSNRSAYAYRTKITLNN